MKDAAQTFWLRFHDTLAVCTLCKMSSCRGVRLLADRPGSTV